MQTLAHKLFLVCWAACRLAACYFAVIDGRRMTMSIALDEHKFPLSPISGLSWDFELALRGLPGSGGNAGKLRYCAESTPGDPRRHRDFPVTMSGPIGGILLPIPRHSRSTRFAASYRGEAFRGSKVRCEIRSIPSPPSAHRHISRSPPPWARTAGGSRAAR